MQLLADMLPAAMLGLLIAIPFGPIGLMCVERTLAFGVWFGVASGIGAATAALFTVAAGRTRSSTVMVGAPPAAPKGER